MHRIIHPKASVMLLLLLIVVYSLYVAACGGSQQLTLRPSDIRPLPNATWTGNGRMGSYVPIRGLDSRIAAAKDVPAYVLIVHGMGTSNPGYSITLQRGVAQQLGLRHRRAADGSDSTALREITRDYNVDMAAGPQPLDPISLPPAQLREHVWEDNQTGQARLVMYEMLWAPTRDVVKAQFFECFEAGAFVGLRCPEAKAVRNTTKQAKFNGLVKNQVIVDGLSDATIVLGPVGDVLRDDVTLAMCLMSIDVLRARGVGVRPDAGRTGRRCDIAADVPSGSWRTANSALGSAQVSVLTHSLGSFLVMDAQWRALDAMGRRTSGSEKDTARAGTRGQQPLHVADSPSDSAAAQRDLALFFLMDGATVFMRANQIALLMLARLQPHCTLTLVSHPCPNEALRQSEVWGPQPRSTFTQYVAFNDADDLLGMELPPYLSSPGLFGTMVNVSVHNPSRHFFSLFRYPAEVHTRSDENPAVIEAIAHGFAIQGTAFPESLSSSSSARDQSPGSPRSPK